MKKRDETKTIKHQNIGVKRNLHSMLLLLERTVN